MFLSVSPAPAVYLGDKGAQQMLVEFNYVMAKMASWTCG